jgi:hypothetical protein
MLQRFQRHNAHVKKFEQAMPNAFAADQAHCPTTYTKPGKLAQALKPQCNRLKILCPYFLLAALFFGSRGDLSGEPL